MFYSIYVIAKLKIFRGLLISETRGIKLNETFYFQHKFSFWTKTSQLHSRWRFSGNESRIWPRGGRSLVFHFIIVSAAAPKSISSEFNVMEVFSFSLNQHSTFRRMSIAI